MGPLRYTEAGADLLGICDPKFYPLCIDMSNFDQQLEQYCTDMPMTVRI
jgi:hypothetical protein